MTLVEKNESAAHPLVVFRHQVEAREGEFKAALPTHIPAERFTRVLITAVTNNPSLLTKVDRRTLFNAAMRAAQDGLMPDGREGAIVEFAGKAQWMPMIAGLRKKVRNSGEIATWEAHVVFENDAFEFELGDNPFIMHKPALTDRGKPILAYSIAVLKTGEKSREVMSIAEIEKVRSASRSKGSGPWTQWWEEMARKTVARRHSKVLPMSSDLDELFRRDEDDDESEHHAEQAMPEPRIVSGLASKLETLGADPDTSESVEIEINAETGEIIRQHSAADPDKPAADEAGAAGVGPPANAAPAKGTTTPKGGYTDALAALDAEMASTKTLDELDEAADKAREGWLGEAPKAAFNRASIIYRRHRERLHPSAFPGDKPQPK